MSFSKLATQAALNRGDTRAALRQMWKSNYITITPTRRLASLPINGHYKPLMVDYHADGLSVSFGGMTVALNHDTEPDAIAALFGIGQHVDVVTSIINFEGIEPAPAMGQVDNSEEQ